MALLCEACNTENRDAAKFCKGCGRKIARAWPQAATPGAALLAAGDATVLMGGGSLPAHAAVHVPAPAAAAPRTLAPVPAPDPSAASATVAPAAEPSTDSAFAALTAALRARPKIGNGRWIGGVAVAVALLVAAAGWYGHKNRSAPIEVSATPSVAAAPDLAVSAPSNPPAAAPSVATAPAEPAVPAATPPVVAEKIEVATGAPEATPKAAAKPRPKSAKKAEPPPVVVQEAPAPPPPAPAPTPVVVQTPQSQCAGLNFIASARCMAQQCARPQFASHAQCEAVRRQQRAEEEARNPSMGG